MAMLIRFGFKLLEQRQTRQGSAVQLANVHGCSTGSHEAAVVFRANRECQAKVHVLCKLGLFARLAHDSLSHAPEPETCR